MSKKETMNRPYQIRIYKKAGNIISILITRMNRGKLKETHFMPTPNRVRRITELAQKTSSKQDKSETFDYYAKWF
jgi:hypothetical protein